MSRVLACALLALSSLAHSAALEFTSLPETTVLAVAPESSKPSDYAAAFGKLVGFYAQPNHTFKIVFPQLSLSLNGHSYSAIAITGTPESQPGIEILTLPACMFAHSTFVGNYPGLVAAVEAIIAEASTQGFSVNRSCGVRVLHANSPDDTPVDKLIHEIYVPVVKRQP